MSSKTESVPLLALDFPAIATGQKLFLATAKLQGHMFKAMLKYQIEALTFLKHRYEQDVKFMDDLAAGGQFNKAFSVLSDFMQDAASEYSTEVSKIAALGSDLAFDTAKRIRKAAE